MNWDRSHKKAKNWQAQTFRNHPILKTNFNVPIRSLVLCFRTDKRIEDERRKQEWEERAQRQEEQRQRKALEDKRVEALARNLERWRERQQVLGFVVAVEAKFESGSYADPDAVREWIDWARRYADRIDPLSDGLPKLLQREDFSEWELR